MKKITIALALVFTFSISCKTIKKVSVDPEAEYQASLNQNNQKKVFSVPDESSEQPAVEEKAEMSESITIRKEVVTFTQPEDKANNDANNYFIIVGSFNEYENAKEYKQILVSEGFTPIILHSQTSGYYRVCVNSHKEEYKARQRVDQIRREFPKYWDSWLLVKQ